MILVLGGTTEAGEIALGLEAAGVDFIVSFAGATGSDFSRSYTTRQGGFGGSDGLVEYLGKKEITAVIDATHPFAAQMSGQAAAACAVTNIPIVRYERPTWAVLDGCDWSEVSDLDAAARALPGKARAFLTVGTGGLDAFRGRGDVWFLVRSIREVLDPEPNWTVFRQRPPFSIDEEVAVMRTHGITHLVTKNSGGAHTRAKIDAATELSLRVIVVGRPVLPVVESASTVSDILRWAEKI